VRQHLTAFDKAIGFISASIEQVTGITKPQKKFLTWLFEKWIMLPVRHNFLNIYRYGNGDIQKRAFVISLAVRLISLAGLKLLRSV